MELDLSVFQEKVLLRDVVATGLLLAVVIAVRGTLLRLVKRTQWADQDLKLRWRTQIRHAALAIVAVGLFLVWGSELRTLAISLVAVAVALVIATKELILCVMGAVLRASSRSFGVGDRTEIGGVRGDVIDTGIFVTRILETGPAHERTGRAILVPNSVLLTSPAINETFTHEELLLHVVSVPLTLDDDWQAAEAALLEAARSVTAEYLDETRASLTSVARNHHLEGPDADGRSAEPQVLIQLPAAGELQLSVRVPTPVRQKGRVEQRILRRYLEQMTAHRRVRAARRSDTRELRSWPTWQEGNPQ